MSRPAVVRQRDTAWIVSAARIDSGSPNRSGTRCASAYVISTSRCTRCSRSSPPTAPRGRKGARSYSMRRLRTWTLPHARLWLEEARLAFGEDA